MAIEFKLPDIGEGVAEGEIVKWLVAEGDALKADQPMVEVMTDKATVEITSPADATVEKILHQEGEVVPVHEVIVVLAESGGAPAAAAAAPAAKAAPAAAAAAPASAPAPAPAAPPAPAPSRNGGGDKVLATPATRKFAREMQVDIATIQGTGPRGRITRDDVQASLGRRGAGGPAAPAAVAPAAAPVAAIRIPSFDARGEERIPYRGLRRAVGDQMVRSAYTAPHFTLVEEVDMTELWALRKTAAVHAADQGVKLTFLPFIVRALTSAIRRHPTINAHMDTDGGEIIVKQDVHVGIATDTDKGLIVPVVKHCDRLSTLEIGAEIQRLAAGARSGSLPRAELTGSTITITSAGSIGGLFATPIINHPEVAILGVYQIKDKPVIRDGQVVPGKIGYLSITLDHRVVDGGTAARVMTWMKQVLEQPGLLLLDS